MMKPIRSIFPVLLFISVFISSCKDHENPEPINEEELITTIVLSFQKLGVNGLPEGEPVEFQWLDSDGSSGAATPEIDAIVLSAHSTYEMNVTLLNESKTPAENISDEVKEEGTAHQFFFSTDEVEFVINYNDEDEEGLPIGLENIAILNHEGTGTLTVILRHEPDKAAAGVSEGEIENAGGDTDIEATFPLSIVE